MSKIAKARLERMRAVTAAHAVANTKISATISLHAARLADYGCTCQGSSDPAPEVSYPGYKRIPVHLTRLSEDASGKAVNFESTIYFPMYKGKFPLVITHVAIWTTQGVCVGRARLRSSCVVRDGDVMSLPPGSLGWEGAWTD